MEINVGPLSKQQAEEVMSICFMCKKILKNPNIRLRNKYTGDIIFLSAYIVFTILAILFGIYIDSMIIMLLSGMLLGLVLMIVTSIRASVAQKKAVMASTHNVKYTLGPDGFESDSEIKRLFIKWDRMKFIRIEKYFFYFIPKELTGVVLGLPIEYKDQVLAFLKENNLNFDVYDMTK